MFVIIEFGINLTCHYDNDKDIFFQEKNTCKVSLKAYYDILTQQHFSVYCVFYLNHLKDGFIFTSL